MIALRDVDARETTYDRRPAGAVIEDAVIGDRAVIGARNELRAGARVWPDAVLAPGSVRFSADT